MKAINMNTDYPQPSQKLMGRDCLLIDYKQPFEISYELFECGFEGVIRIIDNDAKRVVAITRYPNFGMAHDNFYGTLFAF